MLYRFGSFDACRTNWFVTVTIIQFMSLSTICLAKTKKRVLFNINKIHKLLCACTNGRFDGQHNKRKGRKKQRHSTRRTKTFMSGTQQRGTGRVVDTERAEQTAGCTVHDGSDFTLDRNLRTGSRRGALTLLYYLRFAWPFERAHTPVAVVIPSAICKGWRLTIYRRHLFFSLSHFYTSHPFCFSLRLFSLHICKVWPHSDAHVFS